MNVGGFKLRQRKTIAKWVGELADLCRDRLCAHNKKHILKFYSCLTLQHKLSIMSTCGYSTLSLIHAWIQDAKLQDQDQDPHSQDQDQDWDPKHQDQDQDFRAQDQDFQNTVSRPRPKSWELQACINRYNRYNYSIVFVSPTTSLNHTTFSWHHISLYFLETCICYV